jgi:hypothetical protein
VHGRAQLGVEVSTVGILGHAHQRLALCGLFAWPAQLCGIVAHATFACLAQHLGFGPCLRHTDLWLR